MGEPKAFASLSSGLLARKGAARPAMRPQGFGQVGASLEDLGWNDMGFEAPKPALAQVRDETHDAFGDELSEPALRNPLAALTPSSLLPVASPVHDQQAEIADRFADYTEEAGDEEYVDETAELYDPEAQAALDAAAEAEDEDDAEHDRPNAVVIDHTPVLSIKPNRPVVVPVAFAPAALAPVAVEHVVPVSVPRQRAAPGSKAKAAFTLRLDAERHLKLRLACAVTGRSAQQLVTAALDELLGAMPELETMAERAPKKHAHR